MGHGPLHCLAHGRTTNRGPTLQAQRERGPGLVICSKTNGRSAPDLRGAELPQFRTILEELQSEGAAGSLACHCAVGRSGGSSAQCVPFLKSLLDGTDTTRARSWLLRPSSGRGSRIPRRIARSRAVAR